MCCFKPAHPTPQQLWSSYGTDVEFILHNQLTHGSEVARLKYITSLEMKGLERLHSVGL